MSSREYLYDDDGIPAQVTNKQESAPLNIQVENYSSSPKLTRNISVKSHYLSIWPSRVKQKGKEIVTGWLRFDILINLRLYINTL